MASDQQSLGDFFAKKGKKKIKGTNLNNATTDKAESKKSEKRDVEEEGWGEEEQVVAATLKVEAAGKLIREEEKKPDEAEGAKAAWGSGEKKAKASSQAINEKKFPTLSASVRLVNSNINIDDGADGKVNIATSKNVFDALENSEDEDEGTGPRRPKEIKPALVRKNKGEFATAAVQREVDKYVPKKGEEDEEAEDSDAEEKEKERAAKAMARKKAKEVSSAKVEPEEKPAAQERKDEEDTKIQLDPVASQAKYEGRRKLPRVELPSDELKELKPEKQTGKKKMQYKEEDPDAERKLAFWGA